MMKTKKQNIILVADNIRSQLRRAYALDKAGKGDYSFWENKEAQLETEEESRSFIHTAMKLASCMSHDDFNRLLNDVSNGIYGQT